MGAKSAVEPWWTYFFTVFKSVMNHDSGMTERIEIDEPDEGREDSGKTYQGLLLRLKEIWNH